MSTQTLTETAAAAFVRPAGSGVLAQTWYMTQRLLRALLRQPWMIVVTMFQPILWLTMFSALFKGLVDLPGVTSDNYVTFLVPGVVLMSALFSSAWSGTGFIQDIEAGVMDRMLTSPVRRGALIAGAVGYQAIITVVQSVVLILLGLAIGARYDGGALGLLLLIAVTVLFGCAFASLSNALALVSRKQEMMIMVGQLVALPLMFVSSALVQPEVSADWIGTIARYNPVDWVVRTGREVTGASPDWGYVWPHTGYLVAFLLVCGWLSVRAFRSYQRSQ